jgi:hypothetical protein
MITSQYMKKKGREKSLPLMQMWLLPNVTFLSKI